MGLACVICVGEANPIKSRNSVLIQNQKVIQYLFDECNFDYKKYNIEGGDLNFDFCDACFELLEGFSQTYSILQEVKGQVGQVVSKIKSEILKSNKEKKEDSSLSISVQLFRNQIIFDHTATCNSTGPSSNITRDVSSVGYFYLKAPNERAESEQILLDPLYTDQINNVYHDESIEDEYAAIYVQEEDVKVNLEIGEFKQEQEDIQEANFNLQLLSPFNESTQEGSSKNEKSNSTISKTTTNLNRQNAGDTGRLTRDCELCNKSFAVISEPCFALSALESLRAHYNEQHCSDEKRYSCDTKGCNEKFIAKIFLQQHLKSHKFKSKNRTCTVCGKIFPTHDRLYNHMRMHSLKYFCEICPEKTFTAKNLLLRHVVKVHETSENEKTFACSKCQKKFVTNFMLQRHIRFHAFDKTKTLVCEFCEYRFSAEQEGALRRHIQNTHHQITPPKTFKCSAEGCSKLYAKNVPRLRHERRLHPELMIYSCDVCEQMYSVKEFLETHKKTHLTDVKESDIENGSFSCCVCKSKFTSKETLADHLLIHTGEKKIKCGLCNERLLFQDDLRNHMVKKHNIENPFACHICGKKFSTKTKLLDHSRYKHSNIQNEIVPCIHCGKLLRRKRLRNHINTVHKPRFKQCEKCGKSIKYETFTIHMKRHDGIKRYECYFCKKRFVDTYAHKTHMLTHTGERPYICKFCHRGFTQAHCLKTHLKSHVNNGTDIRSSTDNPKQNYDVQPTSHSNVYLTLDFDALK